MRMAFDRLRSPLTTLRMPAGRPASIINRQAHRHARTAPEGLRMKALPQAMAGPNFHIGIMAGS